MGTWGVKIWESDLALDVRADFQEIWQKCKDDKKATSTFLEKWKGALSDPDDNWVVIPAIADYQFDLGRLDPRILASARKMLASGNALGSFRGTPDEPARRNEIQRLINKLSKVPPKPKKVPPAERLVDTEFKIGDVILWSTKKGNLLLWVFGIEALSKPKCPRLELLDWVGDSPPTNLNSLDAAQKSSHVPLIGAVDHRNKWFLVLDLMRRRDPFKKYKVIADKFRRKDFPESKAAKYGLGSVVLRVGGAPPSLSSVLDAEAALLHS